MPFEDVNYLNCRKSIINLASNRVDVVEVANELLNTTQIKMFPDSLIDEYDYVLYADIFLHLARMYMQEDVDLDALSSKYNLYYLKKLNILRKNYLKIKKIRLVDYLV